MRVRAASHTILAVTLLAFAFGGTAVAEGFRNITSVTLISYWDGSFRVASSDAFLARIAPAVTILARVSRNDMPGYNQHVFTLGPVVNFSAATYGDMSYGLGIDSEGAFTHEAEANFTYETDSSQASAGVRAVFFPSSEYYFFLPSVSGRFHPVPALGLFGKAFISVDSAGVVTNAFWGEADCSFSARFTASLGFTLSRAEGFGYSLIAGARFAFTPTVSLHYSLQYLSDTVAYLASPQPRSGISNGLVLDWRF